jgi:nitronate monooxygenase
MFHSPLRSLLGVEIPIVNAPMTPQAGGALARAVTDAGGFGVVGLEDSEPRSSIDEQLALVHGIPFGIGLVGWMVERRPELLDIAVAAGPKMVCVSFGDPAPYVARLHDEGILVASQVQSRRWAEAALAAGVDILVAQGTEAGGHTGAVGTLPLLQIILDMTELPVLAAGGIATGRGLAAVLAAGAAGAWIGTPFLLAHEARNSEAARDRLRKADETKTIYTHVFDAAQGKPWPEEFRGRALANDFTDRWHRREQDLVQNPAALEAFRQAKLSENFAVANLYAGQSIGISNEVRPARDIVRSLAEGAERALARLANPRD